MMLILTGEKGSGKTTLVRKIVSENGITAQGFLSVKEMDQGVVNGISLLILPELGVVPMASTTPMETDMFTKRFYFHPGVFDRVNSRFRNMRPGIPFIFDEFGLLEMEGKGHYPVFESLLRSAHPALIVVRSELAKDLALYYNNASEYRMIRLGDTDTAAVASRIAAFLKTGSSG